MKNVKHFLLLCTILILSSCQHDIGKYFNRPDVIECISNDDGTMWCNGELFQAVNTICAKDAASALEYQNYCMDKEKRLYTCLKFPKQCK